MRSKSEEPKSGREDNGVPDVVIVEESVLTKGGKEHSSQPLVTVTKEDPYIVAGRRTPIKQRRISRRRNPLNMSHSLDFSYDAIGHAKDTMTRTIVA